MGQFWMKIAENWLFRAQKMLTKRSKNSRTLLKIVILGHLSKCKAGAKIAANA